MEIAPRKGCISDVGSFFRVSRPVNFGELVARLDNEEEIDHSYTNWLGAGVVP